MTAPASSEDGTVPDYEILRPLGAGGMGEVYLARDRRLGREVAIKFVASHLVAEPRSITRLRREARLLAALKHPNIAAIHDMLEIDGRVGLVLEYVEGETLRQRLHRGPLEVGEVLSFSSQIASALAAAHAAGVVHRDVKPGNVMVRQDGIVKLLDFGIGKLVEAEASEKSSERRTQEQTGSEVVVGTPGYLSPEQARGAAVDRRTDVWSFGCLLFEMLAGRPAFPGLTGTDRLAAVMKDEPDWTLLPVATPAVVRDVLRQALQKDPERRLRDLGDARLLLEGARTETPTRLDRKGPMARARTTRRWLLIVAVAGGVVIVLALVAAAGFAAARLDGDRVAAAETPEYLALPVTTPPSLSVDASMDISGDGRVFVYTDPGNSIWVADRSEPRARRVGEGLQPFLSQDGRWIGAFDRGPVIVPVRGGDRRRLAAATDPGVGAGGCFLRDGSMIFARDLAGPLLRIPQGGGPAEAVTRLADRGEISHRWPHPLPDGTGFVYTVKEAGVGSFDDAVIRVHDLATGEDRVVLQGGSDARVAPSGHLVVGRAGRLVAAAFDRKTMTVDGAPTTVQEGVVTDPATGKAWYALTDDGDLCYVAGEALTREARLAWIEEDGGVRDAGFSLPIHAGALSPDGRKVATTLYGANDKIWLVDLDRGVTRQLTFGPGNDHNVCWSPDGERLAFTSDRTGDVGLFVVEPAGTSGERVIFAALGGMPNMLAATRDGVIALLSRTDSSAAVFVPWEGAPSATTLATWQEPIAAGQISPDGRWLAVTTSDRRLYVEQFPGPGARVQGDTAMTVHWSTDGRALVTTSGQPFDGSVYLAPFEPGPPPRIGPRRLLATRPDLDPLGAADGAVLVLVKPPPPTLQVRFVRGFRSILEREVPLRAR